MVVWHCGVQVKFLTANSLMSSATLPPSGKQRSYKKDRKEDPTQLPGPSTSQDDSHGLKRPRDATEKTNNQQPKKKRKRQSELGELHQGNPRHHDSSHTLNESSAGGPLAVYTSAELEEKAVKTQRKAERKIAKEKKRIERLQSLPAPAVQALGPGEFLIQTRLTHTLNLCHNHRCHNTIETSSTRKNINRYRSIYRR